MKTYEKPQIFFESFEVSQHVAACGWDMSNSVTPENCSAVGDSVDFTNPPITIFVEGNSQCLISKDPQLYCYENSTDDESTMRVFNS